MAYDFGKGISGGLAGAAGGAATGSVFGPIGTGVGALVGGITGLFSGKKKKKKKASTFDKRQEELNKNYHQAIYGQGPLGDLYDYNPEMANQVFDQNIGRPAYRNFQENIIPQITGQFRGGNIMNSSYAGQALSRAGRDVQEGLDAKRSEYLYSQEQNSRSAKQSAIDKILDRQTFAYDEEGPGALDQILGKLGEAGGEYVFDYLKSLRKGAP